MKAVKSVEALKLEVIELPIPVPSDDEALIQIKKVGICGSDIQIYHGLHRYMTFPVIQGHEGIGIVQSVGKNVSTLQKGDHVVLFPQVVCGKCYACRHGRSNVCESLKIIGVHANGLFSEYVSLKSENLIKIPETVSDDFATLIEPLAVGVAAARKAGAAPGTNIVVLGAGTIGNLTAQACKAAGARVLLADPNGDKLKLAEKMGLACTGNNAEQKLSVLIEQSFEGNKPDAIIDCAAVDISLQQAIENAANSSRIVIVGNFKKPFELEIPKLQRREIDLLSIMMYMRQDFIRAVSLMAENRVHVDEIITRHFPLEELPQAYQYIDENSREIMKILIDVT